MTFRWGAVVLIAGVVAVSAFISKAHADSSSRQVYLPLILTGRVAAWTETPTLPPTPSPTPTNPPTSSPTFTATVPPSSTATWTPTTDPTSTPTASPTATASWCPFCTITPTATSTPACTVAVSQVAIPPNEGHDFGDVGPPIQNIYLSLWISITGADQTATFALLEGSVFTAQIQGEAFYDFILTPGPAYQWDVDNPRPTPTDPSETINAQVVSEICLGGWGPGVPTPTAALAP